MRQAGRRRAAGFQLEHKASRSVGLPLRLGRCTMSWSTGMVPCGADQTVYLVVDSFGVAGAMYRETEIERADLEPSSPICSSGSSMLLFASSRSTRSNIGRRMCHRRWPKAFKRGAISRASRCRSMSGISSRVTAPSPARKRSADQANDLMPKTKRPGAASNPGPSTGVFLFQRAVDRRELSIEVAAEAIHRCEDDN